MDNNNVDILLVEDDEVDIMNVKRAFKKNNISNKLHITRNGIEALDFLKGTSRPEQVVVLLDINMPKMNGLELLEQIRNDSRLKKLNVFVMTTSNTESDIISAYNFNVAGYILKPLSFERFIDAVKVLNHYWQLCERL